MPRTTVLALALTLVALPADAIQKCVTPSGDVVYTDTSCPSGSEPKERIQYRETAPGLRPGEQRMLDDIYQREAEARDAKRYEREREARNRVGYGDRQRIRELEMEKRALSKSLSRGSKDWSERNALETQIIGIDRQIEQIRAPNW